MRKELRDGHMNTFKTTKIINLEEAVILMCQLKGGNMKRKHGNQ